MSQAPDAPEGEITESQMAPPPKRDHTPATVIGWGIFASRWIQAPLYIGLIAAQAVYVVKFWKELIHLVTDF